MDGGQYVRVLVAGLPPGVSCLPAFVREERFELSRPFRGTRAWTVRGCRYTTRA